MDENVNLHVSLLVYIIFNCNQIDCNRSECVQRWSSCHECCNSADLHTNQCFQSNSDRKKDTKQFNHNFIVRFNSIPVAQWLIHLKAQDWISVYRKNTINVSRWQNLNQQKQNREWQLNNKQNKKICQFQHIRLVRINANFRFQFPHSHEWKNTRPLDGMQNKRSCDTNWIIASTSILAGRVFGVRMMMCVRTQETHLRPIWCAVVGEFYSIQYGTRHNTTWHWSDGKQVTNATV